MMRGVNVADGGALPASAFTLKVPVLAIGGTQDLVTRADQLGLTTKLFAANGYTEKQPDAGHWLMLEKPGDISTILQDFTTSAE